MLTSRDPFARTEIHRERVLNPGCTCHWCGQVRMTKHARPRPYLFQFRIESDGGRSSIINRLYCSAGCMVSYNS